MLISPLLLAIAIGVKLSSPGPVIFRQRRNGLDGEEIIVYKFRSMRTQDDGAVVQQATKDDPRITPFGAFLRRTSLDELPQFINVLQGRMSIVGPRPHAVAHNEQYRQLIKAYMVRHKVKPGITGWAQVNGHRGETDTIDKMQARVEYDLEYLRNWSLGPGPADHRAHHQAGVLRPPRVLNAAPAARRRTTRAKDRSMPNLPRRCAAALLVLLAPLARPRPRRSPYYLGVSQTFGYDSNIFRLPDRTRSRCPTAACR